MKSFGGQSNIGEIRSVLLKRPEACYISQGHIEGQWRALHYTGAPDFQKARKEYDAFLDLLDLSAMQFHFLPEHPGTGLDSIYTHDPFFICDKGAVLLSMGKEQRMGEPEAGGAFLETIGVPVIGRITGEGRLEGGDLMWLDARTLVAAEGYRTNAEGIRQLAALLGDSVDEIIRVPLPHWNGPDECLHLLSMISLVDHRLAVVYSRLMAIPFRRLLLDKGFSLVEVPDDEYESLGCNVLPLSPGRCIMVAGNPVTRARLERAGVEVLTYQGEEISLKGVGGPTCLTKPLLRL